MKAEELMIGDWLYHVDDVDISNPQIVTGILSNGEIYVDAAIYRDDNMLVYKANMNGLSLLRLKIPSIC